MLTILILGIALLVSFAGIFLLREILFGIRALVSILERAFPGDRPPSHYNCRSILTPEFIDSMPDSEGWTQEQIWRTYLQPFDHCPACGAVSSFTIQEEGPGAITARVVCLGCGRAAGAQGSKPLEAVIELQKLWSKDTDCPAQDEDQDEEEEYL